jgi:hypothetical protein
VAIVLRLMALEDVRYGRVCLVAFLAAAGYILEDFRTGNIHFLFFFLVVAAIHLVDRRRTVLPSSLLALATAFKLTPILFVFYYGLRKRYALCLSTMAALIVLLLLPALFVGVEANNTLIAGYIKSLTNRFGESGNHALRGVLFRYLTENDFDAGRFPSVNVLNLPMNVVTVLWLALTACAFAGLTAGVVISARNRLSAALEYGLLTVGMLLLSPHTLRMYFSILFFPFCILTGLLMAYPAHPYRRLIKITLGASCAAGTVMPLILPGRRAALAYEALSPHFAVAVLACASLGVLWWRTGTRD